MKTLPSSWKKSLATILAKAAARPQNLNTAILGIGNELNGDDAAGVQVIRRLKAQLDAGGQGRAHLLLIEAGLAPESFSGPLRRFRAELVLMIDAAAMSEEPGSVGLLDWHDTTGFGPSTHLQPPSTLAEFLCQELGCHVVLVGIQPGQMEFGAPLSGAVERAVDEVVDDLVDLFCPVNSA
jgi:hydrogenase 3 maturation protease